jgi:hypothetical protein
VPVESSTAFWVVTVIVIGGFAVLYMSGNEQKHGRERRMRRIRKRLREIEEGKRERSDESGAESGREES